MNFDLVGQLNYDSNLLLECYASIFVSYSVKTRETNHMHIKSLLALFGFFLFWSFGFFLGFRFSFFFFQGLFQLSF